VGTAVGGDGGYVGDLGGGNISGGDDEAAVVAGDLEGGE